MTAIRVENLGKRYVIGHQQRQDTLRDAISHGLKSTMKRLLPRAVTNEGFWALKDLSFEVNPGQALGIIGRNGAGKSTLLKLLSRITEPTLGEIRIRGRVASLLEVGTGFHPELSGRENIYLNGAILGMTRQEIKRRFDEIVAFAEVERFLDTPVKRYSSGMYVRLAFSVAAHLEPEILIVDEVLAVGDAQFQKKCLGKIEEVATGNGRTVLFVSHNLSTIQAVCDSALLLANGQMVEIGAVGSVLNRYVQASFPHQISTWTRPDAAGEDVHLQSVKLAPGSMVSRGELLAVNIKLGGTIPPDVVVGIQLFNRNEVEVLHSSNEFGEPPRREAEHNFHLESRLLNVGDYRLSVTISVRNKRICDQVEHTIGFTITDEMFSVAGTAANQWQGVLAPQLVTWS